MKLTLLLTFTCIFFSLIAQPWGKDADLALPLSSPSVCKPIPASLLVRFGEAAIQFHQEVISPADGPRSHFIPSSSQYTLDAIHRYGFFQGVAIGCDRLMRENDDPWVYRKIKNKNGYLMKWDPVK